MSFDIDTLIEKLYLIPVILISLSFHEFSHAYSSYRLGDPTAKEAGRLTLNPFRHLDILGTIMLLVTRFGWAKPVPINPMYYKNRKKGTMLVSFAGPLSNIFLALISAFPMAYAASRYGFSIGSLYKGWDVSIILYNLFYLFYVININLAIFNLLPVPPLDGSKVLGGILPTSQYYKIMQYERFTGIIFLLVLFMFPGLLSKVLSPLVWVVMTGIMSIVDPIIRLVS